MKKKRLPRDLGFKVLAVWLILAGLVAVLNLRFAGLELVNGALAIAAGILILIQR